MAKMIEIAVSIPCSAWTKALPAAGRLGRQAAFAAIEASQGEVASRAAAAEVSLVLADDALVQALNRDYRGHDRPTNVLSFALADGKDGSSHRPDGAPVLLGDVIIAFETTAAEAGDKGGDLADHLCHLVVHGVLHLLGYGHQTDAQTEQMQRVEAQSLSSLGIADPYCQPDRK
jgi:probable rRNA maturation factor